MSINTQVIRLLIADDHTLIREGMKRIVAENPDMQIIGEARNGDEVLTQIRTHDIDVLLLDISMPGPGFLSILQQLHKEYPEIKVLILSIHPEDHYAVRALKAGAKGYIEKSHSLEELPKAIRTVNKGRTYITPTLAERLIQKFDAKIDQPLHDRLSDRELQVLLLIGTGKTLSDIASTLALSPKTISTYRTRILEKMGFSNNNELIHYSIKNGLID